MKKTAILGVAYLLWSIVRLSAQQWIMPHPWGNPVTDIVFVDDNTGLATVSYDGIYRTTDGGSAWVKVWDTGPDNCFMIDFSPSGEAVVACHSYLLYSQDYGNTWSIRGQLTEMRYLKIQLVAPQQLVSFIGLNAERGYAIGKSADAGQSWVIDTLTWSPYPWMREPYNDISFETLLKGLVITEQGLLYTTEDGGKTLQKINQVFLTDIGCKCTVMASGCYMVTGTSSGKGETLTYYTSYDGGATWSSGYLAEGFTPERIKTKKNPTMVMLYGRDGDLYPPVYVYYSSDTGLTWHWKKIDNGISVQAFDVTPSGQAWAYENEGFYQLFTASLGSNLLVLQPGAFIHDLACVQFAGQIGFALGGMDNDLGSATIVYRSENGGQSWDSLFSVPDDPLDLSFCNEYTGLFASGYGNSELYRTTDGGFHWTLLPHSLGQIKGLKVFPGGVTWLYNSTTLYRSVDYGSTFTAVNYPVGINPLGFYFLNENTVYAFGHQNGQGAVSMSADGGLTWQTKVFPTTLLMMLRMVNEDEGFVLDMSESAVYHLQWSTGQVVEIFNDTTFTVYDLAFSTPQQGYILCAPAHSPFGPPITTIFSTQDGGNTWFSYGPFWNLKRMESFYGMNGIAYGNFGRLMSLAMGYPLGELSYDKPDSAVSVIVEDYGLRICLMDASIYHEARIYDMSGRSLLSQTLKKESTVRLSLKGLAQGLYVLELTGEQVTRVKFVVP